MTDLVAAEAVDRAAAQTSTQGQPSSLSPGPDLEVDLRGAAPAAEAAQARGRRAAHRAEPAAESAAAWWQPSVADEGPPTQVAPMEALLLDDVPSPSPSPDPVAVHPAAVHPAEGGPAGAAGRPVSSLGVPPDGETTGELPRDPAARLIAGLVRDTVAAPAPPPVPPAVSQPPPVVAAAPAAPAPVEAPLAPTADPMVDPTAGPTVDLTGYDLAQGFDEARMETGDLPRTDPADWSQDDAGAPPGPARRRERAAGEPRPSGPPAQLVAVQDAGRRVVSAARDRLTLLPSPLGEHPAAVAAGAVVLVLLLVVLVVHGLGGGDTARVGAAAGPSAAASPSSAPRTVAPDRITVTASSVQTAEGGVDYSPKNLLDGQPDTAWNSNGKRDGRGVGVVLTFTFDTPVDLRSITVLNGYQKTVQRNGKAPLDLFPLNGRVKTFAVKTDTGSWTWALADGRAPLTFVRDMGRTTTLRLEVTAVYPGQKYPDLALSEASFTAVPVG